MQNAELRLQDSTPATPAATKLVLFVNTSGYPMTLDSNGIAKPITARFYETATGVPVAVTAGAPTGFYGTSGRYLGSPDNFLAVSGVNGELWAIPVYRR